MAARFDTICEGEGAMRDEPLTKAYLDTALGELKAELKGELTAELKAEFATKVDLNTALGEMKGEMTAMEQRLTSELWKAVAHSLAVQSEEMRSWFATLDDKYAHKEDYGLHKRPRKR